MKKIVLGLICLSSLSLTSHAQDEPLKNKKGNIILPQKGDFGLGFNAVPVLTFIGNSFNGSGSNSYIAQNKFVSMFGSNTVFGKYFYADNKAIRLDLSLGINSNTYRYQVVNDLLNSPDSFVVDVLKYRSHNYVVGLGNEWRIGKGRLQGVVGGSLFYTYSSSNQGSAEYGNKITETNQIPTNAYTLGVPYFGFGSVSAFDRAIKYNGGATWGLGARLFAGVEYFVAPKISIGAEFGWSMKYTQTNKSITTFEFWDSQSSSVQTREQIRTGSNSFNMSMDNFNGALYLMFHF